MGTMEPRVIDYPPIRLAYVSKTCTAEELPSLIPANLSVVGSAAGRRTSGPPRVYYVAWQDPSGGEVWIGFPVSEDFETEGDVLLTEIPGGRALMVRHDGPYQEMRPAWDAAIGAMKAQGFMKGALSWEDYVDPKPVTDICLEIAECC
jgi:effector-binding domain-containing protein